LKSSWIKELSCYFDGKGQEFVEWYYEYVQKIFDQKIPLMDITNKAKIKQTIDDYIVRSKTRTKAGGINVTSEPYGISD
jgi:hypothetical protein